MIRHFSRVSSLCVCTALTLSSAARADIPASYKGTPFDPAKVGGVGIIPTTVKAGPYAIPGRLDFINYDQGGEKVAFHAGDHITDKEGAGYRTDMPVATFSKTGTKDTWYSTSAALDTTAYPTATTSDFYIGAVQVNDWFNFTVNVQTAGMYQLSTTFASGNGPPGGEGGDGTMGLQVFANDVMLADWKDTFPEYQTKANFHFWKAYPNFATITLAAGPQVIKLQSTSKHLNLDYVEFALLGGGAGTGGADAGGASAGGGAGIAGENAGGSAGIEAASGAVGVAGSAGVAGAVAGNSSAGSTGAGVAGSADTTGAAADSNNGSSCAFAAARASGSSRGRPLAFGLLTLSLGLALRLRRRR